MTTVDQALDLILARFGPLPSEQVPLIDALGQVLAEDVRSSIDVPPLTNAAMDGYAVRSADITTATHESPVRLRVVEDLPAGRLASRRVERGSAIRIMTGAPLPEGADTVVQFELTDQGTDVVAIRESTREGRNTRRAGEDVRRGGVILRAGTPLGPVQLGLLATVGLPAAQVHRRPRVAILSTGDELLAPGQPHTPGKIYDANGVTLAAMTRQAGGVPCALGAAPDDLAALVERVRSTSQVDMFVTSAGVSAGNYDVVKQALTTVGRVDFYQVRMRPGRPLAFGELGGVPLLGLPGNPVAAAISFELFGRPAIRKMLGYRSWARREVQAVFDGEIHNHDSRRSFYRVRLTREAERVVAKLSGAQGSGILSSMAQADGLMVLDEATESAIAGDRVRVRLIGSDSDDLWS